MRSRMRHGFGFSGFVGVGWAYPFAPAASLLICTVFILTGRWKTNRVRV